MTSVITKLVELEIKRFCGPKPLEVVTSTGNLGNHMLSRKSWGVHAHKKKGEH